MAHVPPSALCDYEHLIGWDLLYYFNAITLISLKYHTWPVAAVVARQHSSTEACGSARLPLLTSQSPENPFTWSVPPHYLSTTLSFAVSFSTGPAGDCKESAQPPLESIGALSFRGPFRPLCSEPLCKGKRNVPFSADKPWLGRGQGGRAGGHSPPGAYGWSRPAHWAGACWADSLHRDLPKVMGSKWPIGAGRTVPRAPVSSVGHTLTVVTLYCHTAHVD